MLIEYFLPGWHRAGSGPLKQYNAPGKWWIGRVSPYPLVRSEEGLRVVINTSTWECIWVMEASWDSNYIVNNTEVVQKDDDLVKCVSTSKVWWGTVHTWEDIEYHDLWSKNPSPCQPGFWNKLNGDPLSTHKNPPLCNGPTFYLILS